MQKNLHANDGWDSNHSQRQRVLERLRVSPVDSRTIRLELKVMNPSARIMELKERGYRIDAVWVDRPTEGTKTIHRVALYVLQASEVADDE